MGWFNHQLARVEWRQVFVSLPFPPSTPQATSLLLLGLRAAGMAAWAVYKAAWAKKLGGEVSNYEFWTMKPCYLVDGFEQFVLGDWRRFPVWLIWLFSWLYGLTPSTSDLFAWPAKRLDIVLPGLMTWKDQTLHNVCRCWVIFAWSCSFWTYDIRLCPEIYQKEPLFTFSDVAFGRIYTPQNKPTWSLKMGAPWKRRFLFETIISRFHVNFLGCKLLGALHSPLLSRFTPQVGGKLSQAEGWSRLKWPTDVLGET